jgi:hypothetical protein
MMSGCVGLPCCDIGKAPTKRFNKKQGWTFMDMNLRENGEKKFERLHMPLNQNEICSENGDDEFAIVISRNSNRFCCSPFGI